MKEYNSLQKALLSNALFSLFSAALILLYKVELDQLLNIHEPLILEIISIGLFTFSFFLLLLSRKKKPKQVLVKTVIIMDYIWVLGSLLVILFNPSQSSNSGLILISFIALIVLFMALWQGRGSKNYKNLKS